VRDSVTTDKIAAPVGPFSAAVRAGDFVYLSGQVAQDSSTGRLMDGDVAAQTHGATYRLVDHPPEGRTEVVSQMRGNTLSQAAKCIMQPGTTPDKDRVRVLYKRLRAAFPDFRPEIHWQAAAGNLVTTYKTYHGTHQAEFLGIPPTGKKISFAMRVVDGKITEHWGVATLLDLMQQLGVVPALGLGDDDADRRTGR
jgi:predicted ester cyclase